MTIDVNNYNINYIDEGSGDAVLLLHGWGANLKCFNGLINLLKTKYRVLAIDFPGFGESDMLKTSFSVDDYVDIVINFLNALSIDKIILVGHSYGGRVILKINNRNDLPFSIEKNVMIDAAGIKDKKNIKIKFKIFIFKLLKSLYLALPIKKDVKEHKINELRNRFGSSDYSSAPQVLKETLVKSVNEDLTPYIRNMKETLLIWGKNDTATPLWMGKFMEKNIKNAGLVELNGGHFSYLDDPVTFANVIISYFKLNESI